jgi:hypothetical protein
VKAAHTARRVALALVLIGGCGSDMVDRFETTVDAVCACETIACANDALAQVQRFMRETKDKRASEAEARALTEQLFRAQECMSKLIMVVPPSGGPPSSAAPPGTGASTDPEPGAKTGP